jgi:serine/threonine-protein kinase
MSDFDPHAAADHFARVRAAFHALVELETSQRTAELDRLAESEPQVARDVRSLIEQLDETDLVASVAPAPPSQLGPFRLLHRIGSGGMGEVFLAERVEGGFEQRVAIKLMRATAVTTDLARRFLRERQILARLQHPGIAHLIDGGMTPAGHPWLAMEYVDGDRITDWCVARGLDVAARVRLLLPVCEAVAFAHRNLIIHRDLKPGNLLVDADGRPRLLDFGIAHLGDADAKDQTQAIPAMTLAYAAPEQRAGETATTATDVYQLGVVLRELIVGKVADAASVTNPLLRGDLGRVIDKATAESPGERYASVAMLADDLGDWLERRPLRSGISSPRERLRKTVWQWRWPLAMLATGLLAVGVGAVLVLREARAKGQEAEVSRQTTQFLIGLFQGADPTVVRGAGLSALDLLDQGNARLHGATRLQPLVRARLLRTVADSYVSLGHYDRALSPAQEALTLRQSDGDAIERADSLDQLGNILRLRADYARAEPLLRDALALRRAQLPRDDPATIDSLAHMAALHSAKGDFEAANALFAEAARAAQDRFGEDSVETAKHLDDYAGNLDDMGQRGEALALLRRALSIRERVLGPEHPDVATTLASLGVHLSGSGNYDEAAALLERALAVRRTIYGTAHPLVAFIQIDLAGVYADQYRLDAAERLAQEALATIRTVLPNDHPKINEALNMVALIRMLRRDFTGAIALQREVVRRYAASAGEDHPDTLTAKNNLAYALARSGHAAEAETALRDVIARKRGDNGQGSAHDHQNLAVVLSLQGKHAEAIDWQRRAVAMQEAREGKDSVATAVAQRELAISREMAGDGTDAERDFRTALATAEAAGQRADIALRGWKVPLAAFLIGTDLVGTDRCAEAVRLLHDALAELGDGNMTAEPIARPQIHLLLGACQSASDRNPSTMPLTQACQALLALPGADVDVYPTTRRLLATRCVGDRR